MNVSTARYLLKVLITLLLEGVVILYCQTKPSLAQTVTQVYTQTSTHTEAVIISLAEVMPEDKYSFAPTNVEFKGVRTFAQMVKHIAVNNYVDAAALLRERPPVDVHERDNGPDSVRSKAEILRFVRDSFEYMQKAILTVNQGNLMERVEFPGAQGGIPRLTIIDAAMVHPWDLYGQMIEYVRMNGIDPQAKR